MLLQQPMETQSFSYNYFRKQTLLTTAETDRNNRTSFLEQHTLRVFRVWTRQLHSAKNQKLITGIRICFFNIKAKRRRRCGHHSNEQRNNEQFMQ